MIVCGPVEIVPTTEEHLSSFWEILSEWPDMWADKERVTGEVEFRVWWDRTALDSLTGIDIKTGRIVGGGYLDKIYPGYWAAINIFKRKGYLNPKMIAAVVKTGIPYFFERHDIIKLQGYTRKENKAAIRLLKRVGLKVDGILRSQAKVNGVWADYVVSSILRSEVKT